jgi:hypothetical protein
VHFWLNSDRVGVDAVDVRLTRACSVAGDTRQPAIHMKTEIEPIISLSDP